MGTPGVPDKEKNSGTPAVGWYPQGEGKRTDNLIFCLNATVPIFAIILLGRVLRARHFFAPQTLADLDRLSFKVLLPVLLFRDIAAGRITEQFDLKFFLFCAGVTTVYFFAIT